MRERKRVFSNEINLSAFKGRYYLVYVSNVLSSFRVGRKSNQNQCISDYFISPNSQWPHDSVIDEASNTAYFCFADNFYGMGIKLCIFMTGGMTPGKK